MTHLFLRFSLLQSVALAVATCPTPAVSADLPAPEPIGKPTMKAYRQILPDGRIVYSDKRIEGAKIDETITVDPPIKGNVWTTESGKRPAIPPQTKKTPVNRVAAIPKPGTQKTLGDANADVTHAEMLLEDAKKRQQAGVEPLPGERTGTVSGKSRLNDAYKVRQQALAQAVADAETTLKKAIAERDALQGKR